MIELFSRRPDGLQLRDKMAIARVAVDEDLLSLSATLLDDEYYAAMQGSKMVIDGISIIDQYYEGIAQPFEWKVTRADLESLLSRHRPCPCSGPVLAGRRVEYVNELMAQGYLVINRLF